MYIYIYMSVCVCVCVCVIRFFIGVITNLFFFQKQILFYK